MRPWRVFRPFHESQKGLQALSEQIWPPLGAFIKPPALRVVPDFNYHVIPINTFAKDGDEAGRLSTV